MLVKLPSWRLKSSSYIGKIHRLINLAKLRVNKVGRIIFIYLAKVYELLDKIDAQPFKYY